MIDGDTVEVGGARVRLWGIDAPEKRQECRSGAQDVGLRRARGGGVAVTGGWVAVRGKGQGSLRPRAGGVFRGSGRHHAWLVSEGWALAYRRFAKVYVPEETEARARKRGIHRGEFVGAVGLAAGKEAAGAGGDGCGAVDRALPAAEDLPPLPNAETSR